MDGQKVNLANLKKLNLVDNDCNGYVVSPGNRLTKPLIVEANDFAINAIKMIVLSGGRVIKLKQM